MLTKKAYFFGQMALWHQITRILTKPQFGDERRVVNSAGCMWGECQPRGKGLAQTPVPFGSSVSADFRWFNITTVS
jgi:hypothetical protein